MLQGQADWTGQPGHSIDGATRTSRLDTGQPETGQQSQAGWTLGRTARDRAKRTSRLDTQLETGKQAQTD
jgi:hypothetical protein